MTKTGYVAWWEFYKDKERTDYITHLPEVRRNIKMKKAVSGFFKQTR